MRIKRVLQGTALTALAAAAWMGAGSTDASAKVEVGDVSFNGSSLYVNDLDEEKELMVGFAKVSKAKAKVSAWDVYDLDEDYEVEIDLSKQNVTKDAYIAIMTNDMDKPLYVKIAAAGKKGKVVFRGDTGKIESFKVDDKDVKNAGYSSSVYNGHYEDEDITKVDFSKCQYQGATIYVWAEHTLTGDEEVAAITSPDKKTASEAEWEKYRDDCAKARADAMEAAKSEIDISTVKGTEDKVPVYTLGTFPSKQVKVNIAKQANGPKVPVDYVNGKVTVNKGLEYRIVKFGEDETTITTYAAVIQKETKEVATLLGKEEKDGKVVSEAVSSGVIEVRKTASDKGKGKAASKWTRVKITEPKSAAEDGLTVTKVDVNAATDASIAKVTSSGALEIKYTTKKESKTGIAITNSNNVGFQYYLGADPTTASDKAVKKLKATNGKANIKKDAATGKQVWVRVAGDNKTTRWAGAWIDLGTLPEIK